MPAKYPKLKRARANSGMKAHRTIVSATACQNSGWPGMLLWSTTVIEKQVTTTRETSNGICQASLASTLDWLGVFMARALSIERDIGCQRRHDQDQRQT